MSFWATSTGEDTAKTATTEYDAGGGYITVPDGSSVLAFIKEAKWDKDKSDSRYISVQWKVEKPEEVAGAVIFQKLWVTDNDPQAKDPVKKRDKALKMLATIDNNAGGKLAANGSEPNNDQLAIALVNKQMVITCKIWEMPKDDGGMMKGNWVAAVNAKDKETKLTGPVVKDAPSQLSRPASDDLDDDVPF